MVFELIGAELDVAAELEELGVQLDGFLGVLMGVFQGQELWVCG